MILSCTREPLCALAFALVILSVGAVHAQAQDRTDESAETAASELVYSEAELEQLVAPIALYPDPLLSQIFMASTYPLEVVQAACWVRENPDLEGKTLQEALDEQPWDPSVKSLTAVPEVLAMMNDDLAWTQQLGDAVLAAQDDLLDAVQALRARAEEQGALTTTKVQTVKKKTVATAGGGTETVYEIVPADPGFVSLPAYDPNVVYGDWPYSDNPPYRLYPTDNLAGSALSFAAGVAVGGALWGGFNWDRGYVNVDVDRYNRYYDTEISSPRWQHDAEHRRGMRYPSPGVARRYEREVEPGAGRPSLRPARRPGGDQIEPEAAPAERPTGERKEPAAVEAPAERPKGVEEEPEAAPAERPKGEPEEPAAVEAPAERPKGVEGKPEAAPAERPKGVEGKPEAAPAERPKGVEEEPEAAPAEPPKGEPEEPAAVEPPAERPKGVEEEPEAAPAEPPKGEPEEPAAVEPPAERPKGVEEEPEAAPAEPPKGEPEEPAAVEAPAEPPKGVEEEPEAAPAGRPEGGQGEPEEDLGKRGKGEQGEGQRP